MEFKSPRRAKALALLQSLPDGAFASELFAQLEYSNSKECAKMLSQLVLLKHIGCLPEGTQQAAKRVRYFAPEHEATARAKNKAGKGKTWGMGRAAERTRAQAIAGFASLDSRKNRQALETEKTRYTYVETPVDMRFKVDRPESYFTAMKPGQYVEHDSAIARAYG